MVTEWRRLLHGTQKLFSDRPRQSTRTAWKRVVKVEDTEFVIWISLNGLILWETRSHLAIQVCPLDSNALTSAFSICARFLAVSAAGLCLNHSFSFNSSRSDHLALSGEGQSIWCSIYSRSEAPTAPCLRWSSIKQFFKRKAFSATAAGPCHPSCEHDVAYTCS